MTLFKKKTQPTDIAIAIADAHKHLEKETVGTAEYEAILAHVIKLYELQATLPQVERVSRDTLASGVFSLSGILSVIAFEKLGNGILTTKAMSLLPKIRAR